MTKDELAKHFQSLIFMYQNKKGKDVNNLISSAVNFGIKDFWDAYPWGFRENRADLTTTVGQETVDMPYDFNGMLNVVENTTAYGRKLQRLNPSEYDRLVPDSDSRTNATPKYYKVYYSADNQVWRMALYPTPNAAISLYVNYHTIYDEGDIPDKYIGGVLAGIAKYIAIPGTSEQSQAQQAFLIEVERLKTVDDVDVEMPGKFLTEYEGLVEGDKKWYEPWD